MLSVASDRKPAQNSVRIRKLTGLCNWSIQGGAGFRMTDRSRVVLWAAATKIRAPNGVEVPFWEMPASWNEAEGECKDDACQPPSLESMSVDPQICVKLDA